MAARSNPFSKKACSEESIEERARRLFGDLHAEEQRKNTSLETDANFIVPEEILPKEEIEESDILCKISKSSKKQKDKCPIDKHSFFNQVKAIVSEKQKEEIEKNLAQAIYYHVPENHSVFKEESAAYNIIFYNWRMALRLLFTKYRKACIEKTAFSFYIYVEGAACFFHTPKYEECLFLCCSEANTYSLYINHPPKDYVLLSTGEFQKEKSGVSLSGSRVLFILDTIINYQTSAMFPIPFVISKHLFINSILSSPVWAFKSDTFIQQKKKYSFSVSSWIFGSDISLLNSAESVKALLQ
ncbi:hypothetical protein NEFER03_0303 [Nematocida sp. LUAm3]|nr:hypothetical protein NEFER03_0303 [Nematocida sp. LUAm3]KAI5173755.1 hypothetical protein NEFER02_0271 [Nematocida sp. LUAm2]KAI5176978.1 hypothetical protein NEFER01_0303 [Nematocida sp. LUAm1]